MRSTCEIVADLKDGKEPTYEELKMARLVQSSLLFFYKQDTKSLLKGGLSADLVKEMNYKDKETSSAELGEPTWYWNGIRKDPVQWLGPKNIPGTDDWKEWHKVTTGVLNKVFDGMNQKKE